MLNNFLAHSFISRIDHLMYNIFIV